MMSRIQNAVYGLALGDAFGFVTERMRFPEIVKEFDGKHLQVNRILQISDDTQMSLALIEAMMEHEDSNKGIGDRASRTKKIAEHFALWHKQGNPRGAGKATKTAMQQLVLSNLDRAHDFAVDSKGSGTVMRAPWIGLYGQIADEDLYNFSYDHSLITHSSVSAVFSAYLASRITRSLYLGDLECGQVKDFTIGLLDLEIEETLSRVDSATDLKEMRSFIAAIDDMPEDWYMTNMGDIDICDYTGQFGRADMVLASAIAIADGYGELEPVGGLQRAMMTGGDSDTIGAVAGAFIGASHDECIWEDLPSVLEDEYLARMDRVIDYLEA